MDSDSSVENQKRQADADSFEPVLFRKRWLMLFLFSSVSMLNAFQWLHINIVLPSAVYFWNSSLPSDQQGKDVAIAWLSMLYMLVYIPMIFPATWLLNHYGLRVSILIGATLNMLGAWIKCLSMELSQPTSSPASNASFPLLMVAQLVCALGQVFLLGVPAQLAATWFSKSELAMATAIGVFGNQVGCALGFGLPPLMVPAVTSSTGVADFEDFRKGFRIMFYGGAAIMSFDLLLVAIFFKEEPEIAPSRAQYKRILQRRAQLAGDKPDEADFAPAFDHESSVLTAEESVLVNQSYFHQVAHSFKCVSFIYLNICYGVNTGVYYEIGTLLNSIVAEFFPTGDQFCTSPGSEDVEGSDELSLNLSSETEQVAIGWIGFSMVIAGLVGSIVAGVVLKKTGLYRLVLIIFYFLSVISMGAFMGSLYSNLIGTVFLTMILLGFFQSGFLPLGFEYAAEITYPIDEGLTSGILNTSAHIFGIILTQVATAMIGNYGALPTNIFILVCMVIAGVPACFMKDDLKRQRAHEKMRVEVEANSGDEFKYSSISKTKDV